MMIAETDQAATFKPVLLTNLPIFALFPVKLTNGMTAKLNCSDKITWLKTNKSAVPFSP